MFETCVVCKRPSERNIGHAQSLDCEIVFFSIQTAYTLTLFFLPLTHLSLIILTYIHCTETPERDILILLPVIKLSKCNIRSLLQVTTDIRDMKNVCFPILPYVLEKVLLYTYIVDNSFCCRQCRICITTFHKWVISNAITLS